MSADERRAAVRAALATVDDPELDRSVVELGFVTDITVEGSRAAVAFRLPTFWCSANFAFIMAEDMHAALSGLDWVTAVEVRLQDHFSAEAINTGIAAGKGFRATFGDEATGDLTAIRETFRRKAYLGRMSALIEALRAAGWSDATIVGLTIADLSAMPDQEAGQLAARFLALRTAYGGPADSGEPAFRTADGGAITEAALPAVLRDIRMTRRSAEANGEMCRALLKARNERPAPAEADQPL